MEYPAANYDVFHLRDSFQISAQVRLLGSLLAGIKISLLSFYNVFYVLNIQDEMFSHSLLRIENQRFHKYIEQERKLHLSKQLSYLLLARSCVKPPPASVVFHIVLLYTWSKCSYVQPLSIQVNLLDSTKQIL